jgi:D-sedoheptulose 7-phosphate isomerase
VLVEQSLAYIKGVQETLDHLPFDVINEVIKILYEARLKRRLVIIMGNGGSASTASHFVCDLSKNVKKERLPDFKVIGLTDNMAIFSAYANDEGYENVFARQLTNFVQPEDIVIAISGSGNSMNVIKAVELANSMHAITIGMTGYNGGKLGKLVKYHINVPGDCMEQAEDIHLIIEHLICTNLKKMV